jgi:hypothetical protein
MRQARSWTREVARVLTNRGVSRRNPLPVGTVSSSALPHARTWQRRIEPRPNRHTARPLVIWLTTRAWRWRRRVSGIGLGDTRTQHQRREYREHYFLHLIPSFITGNRCRRLAGGAVSRGHGSSDAAVPRAPGVHSLSDPYITGAVIRRHYPRQANPPAPFSRTGQDRRL